jgi:hypothetical protein
MEEIKKERKEGRKAGEGRKEAHLFVSREGRQGVREAQGTEGAEIVFRFCRRGGRNRLCFGVLCGGGVPFQRGEDHLQNSPVRNIQSGRIFQYELLSQWGYSSKKYSGRKDIPVRNVQSGRMF